MIIEMRYIVFVITCFLFYSCTEKKDPGHVPSSVDPVMSEIELPEEILNPEFVLKSTNRILIYESGLEESIFKILDANDMNLVTSFGQVGEGPNEFSSIISQPIRDNSSRFVSIYDWQRKRLHRIDLAANHYEPNYVVFPPELMLVQRAAYFGDNYGIVSGGLSGGMIGRFNTLTKKLNYFNPFNIDDYEVGKRDWYELLGSEFTINHQEGRIVLSSKYIPEVFIVDSDLNLIKSIKIKDYDLQDIINKNTQDRKNYYHSFSATNNYFYGIYLDLSISELQTLAEEGFDNYSTQIHVYDWDGNLVKKINLKNSFYPFIEVSEDDKTIYTIDRYKMDKIIKRFNLPE